MSNVLEVKFSAKSENESLSRIIVASFAAQLDPTLDELSDIKMAVSEAVTNSIIHGYENKEGIVKLHCTIMDNIITIEVSDTGVGIEDINIAKEPLFTSKPNLERSGMGFTIMQSFMDELNIESVINLGTKITMKKVIKQNLKNTNNQDNICITA